MNPKILSLKLGQHRGNPRVWIEGKQLESYGFTVGARFSVRFYGAKDDPRNCVYVLLDAEGTRTVSGRARKGAALPIVEINADGLRDSLGKAKRITATLDSGTIIIRAEDGK